EMERHVQSGEYDAAVDCDTRFHGLLYEQSRNGLLLNLWRGLQPRIQLMQSYGRLYGRNTPPGQTRANHLVIVEALRSGAIEAVTEAIAHHIDVGRELVEIYLKSKAPRTSSGE